MYAADGYSQLVAKMQERNRLALGAKQFRLIRSSKAVVVGIGGVGSVITEQLIRLGVGEVMYIARGRYELGNINRQIPATYINVASRTKKVHAMAQRLLEIDPSAHIRPVEADVVRDNVLVISELAQFAPHAVFNCVDEGVAQALIASNACALGLPCLIGGVIGTGLEGIVSAFLPEGVRYQHVFDVGLMGDLEDTDKLRAELDRTVKLQWMGFYGNDLTEDVRSRYLEHPETPYPVVTPLPWIIASVMVTEFMKLLLVPHH